LRYVTGIDALGWGDVKLITMLGAFLGPAGMLVVLLVGSVGSSIVGTVMMLVQRRRIGLPFGPPLAAAATVYVLWGDAIPVLLYGH
ncbi:MAG: A24 family peptidase, partial [Myxococcota bacterium]